jgi:hypothetical protein
MINDDGPGYLARQATPDQRARQSLNNTAATIMTTKKIEIDPEIINQTECDKNFVCLSDTPPYCQVINTLGYFMLQLVCQQNLTCRFNRCYGALQTCACPVRREIFTKYRI